MTWNLSTTIPACRHALAFKECGEVETENSVQFLVGTRRGPKCKWSKLLQGLLQLGQLRGTCGPILKFFEPVFYHVDDRLSNRAYYFRKEKAPSIRGDAIHRI